MILVNELYTNNELCFFKKRKVIYAKISKNDLVLVISEVIILAGVVVCLAFISLKYWLLC